MGEGACAAALEGQEEVAGRVELHQTAGADPLPVHAVLEGGQDIPVRQPGEAVGMAEWAGVAKERLELLKDGDMP